MFAKLFGCFVDTRRLRMGQEVPEIAANPCEKQGDAKILPRINETTLEEMLRLEK